MSRRRDCSGRRARPQAEPLEALCLLTGPTIGPLPPVFVPPPVVQPPQPLPPWHPAPAPGSGTGMGTGPTGVIVGHTITAGPISSEPLIPLAHHRPASHRRPPPPPRFQPSALAVTVTTDRLIDPAGAPVTITITETNTSNHDVGVLVGCQILTAAVVHGNQPVWVFRDLRECPTGIGVLHAHQTRQFTVMWNGRAGNGSIPAAGIDVVVAGVDGVVRAAPVIVAPASTATT